MRRMQRRLRRRPRRRGVRRGHIPGAVHLPPAGHPDEAAEMQSCAASHAGRLRLRRRVRLAEGVADRLAAAGFKDVRLLEGSWTEWMKAGGPAQSGACKACSGHPGEHAAEPQP